MKDQKTYTYKTKKEYKLLSFLNAFYVHLFFFLLIVPTFGFGQEEPQYDEVTVEMRVQGIGKADIPALVKNEVAYLSISDVFNLIKIKNHTSSQLDSISGFFINPQDEYLIDKVNQQIIFQGKKRKLKPDDLISTETNLYMKSALFEEVFGLDCAFNLLDISVVMTTKLELPFIREMKIEQMRNNLKRLKGDVKTDTTIGRRYPLFKLGMVDWAISSNQDQKNAPYNRLSLNLGSMVAGGEMNVGVKNYDPSQNINLNQRYYSWRYVNNDLKFLRQISVGKMSFQNESSVLSLLGSMDMSQSVNTTSRIQGSLVGIQITNTPTILRKSFGTFTKTGNTKPDWQVELYLNNVLVDFVKADASGFYKFEIPMVYGNSVITIRTYGPWGEVETVTENTNIPFVFLPPGELEYTINSGVLEDNTNSKFFRSNANYGISKNVSFGGGYEYWAGPNSINAFPFIGSSAMLFNNFLIASEYTLGVRLKNSLSYRLPSSIQLNMYYTGYEKEQHVFEGSPVQESGVSISIPLQGKHYSIYSIISFDQTVTSYNQSKRAFFQFSGYFYGVSTNISTMASFPDPVHIKYASTNFSLSFSLPGRTRVMPSVLYNYDKKRLDNIGFRLQKPIFGKGYLNLSYRHQYQDNSNIVDVGITYDFSFMQTGFNSTINKLSNSFSQTANGSLLLDSKNKYVGVSNYNSVGRSGLTFLAYLDMNRNGKRDKNEPLVKGLNLRVNGGRIIKSEKDSATRVIDLLPYTSYLVELDKNSFKSLSWRINKLNLSVYADPNQFKTIEIPVEVMAEASGTVNLKTKNGTRGLSRIYVNFYQNGQKLSGKVLTEEDGYFSFMGLVPGEYQACIDTTQLQQIKLSSSPLFKTFTVHESSEGDIVEGLDFTLQSNAKDTSQIKTPMVDSSKLKVVNYASTVGKEGVAADSGKTELRAESSVQGVRYSKDNIVSVGVATKNSTVKSSDPTASLLQENVKASLIRATDQVAHISETDGQRCSIQIGDYVSEKDALADQKKITMTSGLPVLIVLEGGAYKLWIEGFNSRREAKAFLTSLGKIKLPVIVDREDIAMDKVKDVRINAIENPAVKNKLIDYTDSIANIYKFEPEGSKTRGFPVKAEQRGNGDFVSGNSANRIKPSTRPEPSAVLAERQKNNVSENGGLQFSILIDGFIFDKSATAALRRISIETKLPIIVSIRNGFYNLLIEGFASRREAKLFEEKLTLMGFKGTIIKRNS